MSNPLLDFTGLPLFDQVQPQHVAPAVDSLLAEADAALETVTQPEFPGRWEDIAKVLDTATERLGRAWGVVSHLNGVADTPELRAAYNEALPKVTDFWTRLGSDERLYAKYKGRLLADLPGNYLAWFAREGFPGGELGRLLALMHEIDHNGLKPLLDPLRKR